MVPRTLWSMTASKLSALFCSALFILAHSVFGAGMQTSAGKSAADQISTPGVERSATSGEGLQFTVDDKGLASLSYNEQSLLVSPSDGALSPGRPTRTGENG